MLVDKQRRWALCLPTKTGSTSVEAAIRKMCLYEGYKHAMTMTPAVKDRLMLWRNPYDRWWSIYRHHLNEGTQFSKVAREQGVNAYAEMFFARCDENPLDYSTYIWTRNLSTIAKWFGPTRLFDVTQNNDLLTYLHDTYGLEATEVPHKRLSKKREETTELDPQWAKRLDQWAKPDLELSLS